MTQPPLTSPQLSPDRAFFQRDHNLNGYLSEPTQTRQRIPRLIRKFVFRCEVRQSTGFGYAEARYSREEPHFLRVVVRLRRVREAVYEH